MTSDKRDQLPHLLALLDDPSDRVQESVRAALVEFGSDLETALDAIEATDGQRAAVDRLLQDDGEADPLFCVGQLVRHKRYGYRGVVVAVDESCQASEDWYQRNRTQPGRDQPWYHVLADGSSEIFYPAQTSLKADLSDEAIDNPYVDYFFSDFENGTYIRNDRPWRPRDE